MSFLNILQNFRKDWQFRYQASVTCYISSPFSLPKSVIEYLPLTYAKRAISILKIYLCSPITFLKICLWAVKPQPYNSAEM